MQKRVLRTISLLARLGVTTLALCPPAQAQGPVPGFVFDEHGKARPVRKVPRSETPLFTLVQWSYRSIINNFQISDAALHDKFRRQIGVEPDSDAARSILKAAFRAEALDLETPRLPTGDRETIMEAQVRRKEWLVRELRKIYVQMLRELQAAGYPLEQWNRYLEEHVRPSGSITIYGEEDEYDRRFDSIEASFAKGIEGEVEAEERTP